MSTSYFDFVESIRIPRLAAASPAGSGEIIFNDEIRGSTGSGSSVSFRPTTTGANVQAFTSSGTWTKPAGVTVVNILMLGGGGGGGSGRRSTGTTGGGGNGGSGGYMVRNAYCLASALANTVSVTVGAGGLGGARQLVSGVDGNPGARGGTSSFGSAFGIQGGRGGAGGGNGTWIGAYTSAESSLGSDMPGGYGTGVPSFGFFPASGGGGGPGGTSELGTAGLSVGAYILTTQISGGVRGSNGVIPGVGGSPPAALYGIGAGGGGGGCNFGGSSTGGAGGNIGAGGGGGGTGSTGGSGAGGNGGSGVIVVISW